MEKWFRIGSIYFGFHDWALGVFDLEVHLGNRVMINSVFPPIGRHCSSTSNPFHLFMLTLTLSGWMSENNIFVWNDLKTSSNNHSPVSISHVKGIFPFINHHFVAGIFPWFSMSFPMVFHVFPMVLWGFYAAPKVFPHQVPKRPRRRARTVSARWAWRKASA